MAWPLTRIRTYAPGDDVVSADLNAIQDEIIAGGHGLKTKIIPAVAGCPSNETQDWGLTSDLNVRLEAGDPDGWSIPITLDIGERIRAVRARIEDGSGSSTLRLTVLAVDDISSVTVGATDDSDDSGNWQDLSIGAVTEVVNGNNAYIARISRASGSALSLVNRIEVDYDQP